MDSADRWARVLRKDAGTIQPSRLGIASQTSALDRENMTMPSHAMETAADEGRDSNSFAKLPLDRFGEPAEQFLRLHKRTQAEIRLHAPRLGEGSFSAVYNTVHTPARWPASMSNR